jgi:hypothetical protein
MSNEPKNPVVEVVEAKVGDKPLLSKIEREQLVIALANGQKQFTQEEAQKVVDWAFGVRVESAALDLVLEGKLVPLFRDGDLVFRTTKAFDEDGST